MFLDEETEIAIYLTEVFPLYCNFSAKMLSLATPPHPGDYMASK